MRATCIAATTYFFPVHCTMPKLFSVDAATLAVNDLIQAPKNPEPVAPFQSLTTDHHCALQQLAQIFNNATTPNADPTLRLNDKQPLRVQKKLNTTRANV
eukprot:5760402-Ditylum_brightwellii.AAC.1